MKIIRGIFFLLLLFTVFSACKKGNLVPRPAFIQFALDVFITDTAVYNTVKLYGVTLSAKPQIINGTYATIVNISDVVKPPVKKVKLIANVIKKNPPNISFSDSINIANVNDYLLLQIDPEKAPVLINKLTETSKFAQPGKDSIKARFFFNKADNIINPYFNTDVTVVDIQLYKESTRSNGTTYAEKDALIKGLPINELSKYFSFKEGTFYGFDLFDGNTSLPNNKRLIQKFQFAQYDHFITSRIDLNNSSSGRFQTIRLQREDDGNGDFIGQYLFAFK